MVRSGLEICMYIEREEEGCVGLRWVNNKSMMCVL